MKKVKLLRDIFTNVFYNEGRNCMKCQYRQGKVYEVNVKKNYEMDDGNIIEDLGFFEETGNAMDYSRSRIIDEFDSIYLDNRKLNYEDFEFVN